MPLFEYSAINPQGKKVAGAIEASAEKEAKERLREQALMIVKIGLKTNKGGKENLKGEQLVTFTSLLAQLLKAGLPLFESLLAIEEQYQGEKFHRVILSLCDQIKRGTSLSQAMSQHPESFNRLYCAMIAAGEAVGMLDQVLEKLGEFLAKQLKIQKQLITTMIYPGVLASFSMIIIVVLLTFVVPSMEPIFEGRKLNAFTGTIVGISHLFRSYWWLFLAMLSGGIGYCIYYFKTDNGRKWLQNALLHIPLVRTAVLQASLGRFCRTMATLQDGGVTILDALRIAKGVLKNVTLEKEIVKVEEKVMEGSSLSFEMGKSKWIPPLVSRMLAVGEEAGTSSDMFKSIATLYENDLEKTLDRVMALAQPVILIFMGGIIAMVMLGILLPMSDISALMGS